MFLYTFLRGRDKGFYLVGFELHAVVNTINPDTLAFNILASRNGRGIAGEGNQIQMAPHVSPDHKKIPCLTVTRHPLNPACQVLESRGVMAKIIRPPPPEQLADDNDRHGIVPNNHY